ncbi:hypothetical protein DA717_12810 [Piscirickettsiaceae bacterium NZ-RLO2]|uniref:hypothetical protein n=1 Tax=Piscirickettsia salmonis TaxID=1238 RepID=UPI000F0865B6|nr:hypothetical protein DA717_15115 [Piscirickettsiaceae bacterium NZ-RLO2]RNC76985.1 hypothetical protein DA717_12810 [Piscirickettsiaceae bacterium NZ-RLO2]
MARSDRINQVDSGLWQKDILSIREKDHKCHNGIVFTRHHTYNEYIRYSIATKEDDPTHYTMILKYADLILMHCDKAYNKIVPLINSYVAPYKATSIKSFVPFYPQ